MKRSISSLSLLFASVSAILGSGWLFTAYYTSKLAGPSAIISWLIGGAALALVAFVFAELSAMLPITGSSTRIPHYTHGSIVSFLFSWIIWLSYASLTPTEVQAVVQYFSYFFPQLVHPTGGLTETGYLLATILMLVISTINIFSLRWLMRSNSILTVMKLVIPTFLSLTILGLYFADHHVSQGTHMSFAPYGMKGMFAAIATGGIVFAFNGFKQACEMAGEAKHPGRTLPIAIIGSIVICLSIYLLLQFAFLASIVPSNLAHGWRELSLQNANSPFAAIVTQNKLDWMLPLIYIGAIAGPLAAGLMYMSSSSRALFGKSKNGYLPSFLQKVNPQGNPFYAIIINFLFGMCLFAPLPGWNKMVSFLTSLMAISYAIAPICLVALRDQAPQQKRPFKIRMPMTLSTISFYICNLLTYWSGWDILSKLATFLLIGLVIFFSYHFLTQRGRKIELNWRASVWIWPYFIGIIIISYLGNFGHGLGVIPFGWDFAIIAIFSIIIIQLSRVFKLPAAATQTHIEHLNLDH